MSLQNTCSDLVHNMMNYMDISELKTISTLCKNLNNDSKNFITKYKKEENLKSLIDKHTCRNCDYSSYEVEKQFCTDCFLYKCDNCFAVRNYMSEFAKYVNRIEGEVEVKLMCCDYCMYRCHKCKLVDTRHELFLNDDIELQTICLDCFVDLDENEQIKYKKIYSNDEWDDLNEID
jgi:hypothetical protein